MAIKLICSDCNGVLEHVNQDYSKTGYYVSQKTVPAEQQEMLCLIREYIFSRAAKSLLESWMRNEISYKQFNKIAAGKFNQDDEFLNRTLELSVTEFEWNWDLINLYQHYRKRGIGVVMTTDNMDIFSLVAVPFNKFDTMFDKIYNSADIGMLKDDNNLQLFKDITCEYDLSFDEILIIDDGKPFLDKACNLGFKTYLYNAETCKNFEQWMEINAV
jgi:FMN phosphatase YigB (HAD superfamily)